MIEKDRPSLIQTQRETHTQREGERREREGLMRRLDHNYGG